MAGVRAAAGNQCPDAVTTAKITKPFDVRWRSVSFLTVIQ